MEQSQQPQPSIKPPLDTGTEIVSRERVVLVEPFNPDENPSFKPKGVRQSRVVLFTRSFLSPKTPEDFVEDHGFALLEKDRAASRMKGLFSSITMVRAAPGTSRHPVD